MARPSRKLPKATTGMAWVGVWQSGELGWAVPNFIEPGYGGRLREPWVTGTLYLCNVTITLKRDRLGRVRTKRVRNGEEQYHG